VGATPPRDKKSGRQSVAARPRNSLQPNGVLTSLSTSPYSSRLTYSNATTKRCQTNPSEADIIVRPKENDNEVQMGHGPVDHGESYRRWVSHWTISNGRKQFLALCSGTSISGATIADPLNGNSFIRHSPQSPKLWFSNRLVWSDNVGVPWECILLLPSRHWRMVGIAHMKAEPRPGADRCRWAVRRCRQVRSGSTGLTLDSTKVNIAKSQAFSLAGATADALLVTAVNALVSSMCHSDSSFAVFALVFYILVPLAFGSVLGFFFGFSTLAWIVYLGAITYVLNLWHVDPFWDPKLGIFWWQVHSVLALPAGTIGCTVGAIVAWIKNRRTVQPHFGR